MRRLPPTILVPLWRPVTQCFLDAFLAVLLGVNFVAQDNSLRNPAYHPIKPLGHVFVGLLFLVPGLIASTLLVGGHRKNSFIPLLFLAGLYSMFAVLFGVFAFISPATWTGAALFGIFAGGTLIQAFTAAELP